MMKRYWIPTFFYTFLACGCVWHTMYVNYGHAMSRSPVDDPFANRLLANNRTVDQAIPGGTGYESTPLPDSDFVRRYRFRNGDHWFRDMKNGRDFFSYARQNVQKSLRDRALVFFASYNATPMVRGIGLSLRMQYFLIASNAERFALWRK